MAFSGILGADSLGALVLAGVPGAAEGLPVCVVTVPVEIRAVSVPTEARAVAVLVEVRAVVIPVRCAVTFPIDSLVFDAHADLPFQMTWTPWLEGATVDSAAVVLDAASSALVTTHDLTFTPDGVVVVWIAGTGSLGTAYVTIRLTASDGRVDDRTWELHVGRR